MNKLGVFGKRFWAVSVLCAMVGMAVACGSGNERQSDGMEHGDMDAGEVQHAPLTLKIWLDAQREIVFKEQVAGQMQAKYPYMSFEYLTGDIADLVAAGTPPDAYFSGIGNLINKFTPLNLQYDMSDLIKQNRFDLSRIDASHLDIVKNASSAYKGTYFGLPVYAEMPILIYNRDLFDKFGVPYPKDGMTWDNAYELARHMTRFEDGVQYRGMAMNIQYLLDNNQLGASYYDQKADKAGVNTDQWKAIFANMSRFYQLPMNAKLDSRNNNKERDDFMKSRVVAMYAGVSAVLDAFPKDFNSWDIATMPTMKEAPNTNFQINTYFFAMMSTSKQKDEVFKVAQYLDSDEVQMSLSKGGKVTVLTNGDIRKAFGQESPQWQGKHVEALYAPKPGAPLPPRDAKLVTIPTAGTMAQAALNDVLLGNKDVNTSLRDYEGKLNAAINEEKSK